LAPTVFADAEYKHLVDVGSITPRDRLMVRVMGEAGLRASEVIGLREEDLPELARGRYQVRVLGKADKERLVSLPLTSVECFAAISAAEPAAVASTGDLGRAGVPTECDDVSRGAVPSGGSVGPGPQREVVEEDCLP
jgi:hypothetical protein